MGSHVDRTENTGNKQGKATVRAESINGERRHRHASIGELRGNVPKPGSHALKTTDHYREILKAIDRLLETEPGSVASQAAMENLKRNRKGIKR